MNGIIIQARLGSTRLPGKILKPFGTSTILLFLIQRLRRVGIPIVVATTNHRRDDTLCRYLEENDIKFYRGEEEDVLSRFIEVAELYGFNHIVRVCSDSPIIDVGGLNNLIKYWRDSEYEYDYLSYSFHGKPTVLTHFGVFAELVKLDALKAVQKQFPSSLNKEHVTYGVYHDNSNFNIKLVELPINFEEFINVRLTIDTKEDYENLKMVYELCRHTEEMEFIEIAEYIQGDSALLKRMESSIAKNQKNG